MKIKQIIQKFWMVMALLCTSLSASAYDFEVGGIYYTVTSIPDLTCEVSSAPGENEESERSHYTGEITIPATVEFRERTLSVRTIGEYAFSGSDVTSVTLPNTVIIIGDYAFSGCTSLTSISLPESVSSIEWGAFYGCTSLSSISLPESLESIGGYAFRECTSLSSIHLPDSLFNIGIYAFSRCTSLTSISLPESVNALGEGTFSGCTSLSSIHLPDSLFYIGEETFDGCTSLSSIHLPDSLRRIDMYAFDGCTSLSSIHLSESLESIDQFAFSNCTSLQTIKLPNSLKYLDLGVFYKDSSLKEINIPANIETIIIGKGGPFQGCSQLKKLRIEADYEAIQFKLDEDDTTIWGYSSLLELFDGINISELSLEHKFKRIEFFKELEKLILGKEINELKNEYNYAHSRYEDNIPETVNEIVCESLVPPSVDGYSFSHSQYLNTVVKVPKESLEAYKNAEPWKNFWNIQGCEDVGVKTIETSEKPIEVARYNLYGRSVSEEYEGIVIVMYSDGSTMKILNRNI